MCREACTLTSEAGGVDAVWERHHWEVHLQLRDGERTKSQANEGQVTNQTGSDKKARWNRPD